MRKSTLLRMCLAVLAVLASFGFFNVTATPAHADLWCAETLGFCTFTHVWNGPDGACCMYSCPNGGVRMGMCDQ